MRNEFLIIVAILLLVTPVHATPAKDLADMLSTAEMSLSIAEATEPSPIWAVKIKSVKDKMVVTKNALSYYEGRELVEEVEVPPVLALRVRETYEEAMKTAYYSELDMIGTLLNELSLYDKSLAESYRSSLTVPKGYVPKPEDVERANKLIGEVKNKIAELELARVNRETAIKSLETLNGRVVDLEKITDSLQLVELREEALKLISDIKERKKLIGQGEYATIEDLTVRASALESDIYKTIEKESLQYINTNSAPEYQQINPMLEEALKKKELTALADALFTYRMELPRIKNDIENEKQRRLAELEIEKQRQLEELHKEQEERKRQQEELERLEEERRKRIIKVSVGIVVLISSIISFLVFKESARRKREKEAIGEFMTQLASDPSDISERLIEDPAVQRFLERRTSEEVGRVLWGEEI